MSKTLEELLGLIDRFAMLHADAREARMEGNIGFQMADDAKLAKAIVEAALQELIADAEAADKLRRDYQELCDYRDELGDAQRTKASE